MCPNFWLVHFINFKTYIKNFIQHWFWWSQSLEKVKLFSHWGSTAGGPRWLGRGGRGRWLLEDLWDSLVCMYGSSGWFAWSGIRETSRNSASSAEQIHTAECETIGFEWLVWEHWFENVQKHTHTEWHYYLNQTYKWMFSVVLICCKCEYTKMGIYTFCCKITF